MKEKWYKNTPTDTIWWLDNPDTIGEHIFSFDKVRRFNLFSDYPEKLSEKEKAVFDSENPFWADFF